MAFLVLKYSLFDDFDIIICNMPVCDISGNYYLGVVLLVGLCFSSSSLWVASHGKLLFSYLMGKTFSWTLHLHLMIVFLILFWIKIMFFSFEKNTLVPGNDNKFPEKMQKDSSSFGKWQQVMLAGVMHDAN